MYAGLFSTGFLTIAMAVGCGSLSTENVGGETSFLHCRRDNDCPEQLGQCKANVCVASEADASSSPVTSTESQPTSTESAISDLGSGSQQAGPASTESLVEAGLAEDAGSSYQLEMIDDMETPIENSRAGFFWRRGLGNWFFTTESESGDALRVELSPSREASTSGYWVGETAEVVDLWAELVHPQHTTVDLSAYVGISFWVLAGSPDRELSVALDAAYSIADGVTDGFATKTLPLSNEWQYFEVSFDELGATSAASIDFIIDARDGAFDLWLDDVALLCPGPCPE